VTALLTQDELMGGLVAVALLVVLIVTIIDVRRSNKR